MATASVPADMKAQISTIIASESRDNLTMKIVRERLRMHYSVDMTPHKKLIKKLTTEVLAEHDAEAEAEAAAEEAQDEPEVSPVRGTMSMAAGQVKATATSLATNGFAAVPLRAAELPRTERSLAGDGIEFVPQPSSSSAGSSLPPAPETAHSLALDLIASARLFFARPSDYKNQFSRGKGGLGQPRGYYEHSDGTREGFEWSPIHSPSGELPQEFSDHVPDIAARERRIRGVHAALGQQAPHVVDQMYV